MNRLLHVSALLIVTAAAYGHAQEAASPADNDTAHQADTATAANPAQEQATGALLIESDPPDAVVVVDDAMKGKTPVTIDGLAAGKHVVVLKKKGYFIKRATVILEADTITVLTFTLKRPLSVVISSEPEGAHIDVDGTAVGVSPCEVTKLAPGEHSVAASFEGYTRAEKIVTLSDDGPDTVHVELTKVEKAAPQAPGKAEETPQKTKLVNRVALALFLAFTLTIVIVELAESGG